MSGPSSPAAWPRSWSSNLDRASEVRMVAPTEFEPVFQSRPRFRQFTPLVARQHDRNTGTRLKHAASVSRERLSQMRSPRLSTRPGRARARPSSGPRCGLVQECLRCARCPELPNDAAGRPHPARTRDRPRPGRSTWLRSMSRPCSGPWRHSERSCCSVCWPHDVTQPTPTSGEAFLTMPEVAAVLRVPVSYAYEMGRLEPRRASMR